MDRSATLAFQAPALTPSTSQTFTAGEVSAHVQVSDLFIADMLKFSMQNSIFVSTSMVNASLVTSILADPHQLVPVDTIEKAARWGIGIGGIKSHWDLTPRTLVQACTNYENWTVDQASTTLKPEDSVDDLKPAGFASGDDEKAFYYWDSGGYADRGCYIAVRNGEGANALDICLVND